MKISKSRLRLLVAIMTLPTLTYAAEDTPSPEALLQETRAVAAAMPPKLMAELQKEMASGGLVSAIAACRDKAPQMARDASAKTGWQIRRVSLKNRNPQAAPDSWEHAVLTEFDQRVAAGADAATLEKAETIDDGQHKTYRYMKALPTQPMCLACHGSATDIPADVSAKLRELYPSDKATGYTVGAVRGAISIWRPLN